MADETISEKCETLYNKLNTFVASVISRDVTPKISNLNTEVWGSNTQTGDSRIDTLESDVTSLDTSIANFNTLNTWEQIWTDGSVSIHCNKAIGVSYLHFNKNVTVSANGSTTIHSQFNSSADEIKCCPTTSTLCPTSRKDIYLTVDYVGGITVYNRSSSAINNSNVQAMMTWRAKGYPE